ncbi:CaiB/BaiF CoA-transferase family protein [Arthrobacter sp. AZCC_0090]|uniref:CaiB/BaiF CoA transferase family protein n=1 Tax=Arthrobacter sp. AZCC_0090 TaxID=2735881 RepID=UPI0016116A01|nr:CoA transferase [Arthrobacter sp. AZCC_0090]MBB6406276.1 crotonobetainyl-CoA:carnitine CoA-transferase CaiB-like acyl-CoA transferase [Arthrobacter sp. AZCC_0090]
MTRILDGIRVVELSSWTFVPAAGAALADWGADVIKVEDTRGGDPGRYLVVSGLSKDKAKVDADYMLEIGNRGKRSVALDVKSEVGYDLLVKLLKTADVFLTNWLPGPLERANLNLEQVRAINPNIIIARGTGQGTRGPDRDKGGFDAASYLARSGFSYAMTAADSEFPMSQGPAFGDLPSGLTLAGGVLGALYNRERTGEATTVDVSLLAQGMWTMAPDIVAAEFFDIDRIPKAGPGKSMNPVVNAYKTKDNRWIQLVFLQPDKFWAGFCVRIGRIDLAVDERFTPAQNLVANGDEAIKLLQETFAAENVDHWTEALKDEPGVWSVIASPQEVLFDPQATANSYLVGSADSHGKEYRLVAPPIQFGESAEPVGRAPGHGQHTEELLLELGLGREEIAAAKESGAVL